MNKTEHAFLKTHPLCIKCITQNPTTYRRATHIGLLFYDEDKNDEDNWIALCDECFNKQKLYQL